MKIKNIQSIAFIKNLTKAYTEGIYADTPANRKLGRVGMTYAEYSQKVSGKQNKQQEKEIDINKINTVIPSSIPTKKDLSKCSRKKLFELKKEIEKQLIGHNKHLLENKKHFGEVGVAAERKWIEANIKRTKNLLNNIDFYLEKFKS